MYPQSKKILVAILFICVSGNTWSDTDNKTSHLIGPYLGQQVPGLQAEMFAPGIISTSGWEYGVVFTPDMKAMYFVREVNTDSKPKQQMLVYQQHSGIWHERVVSDRVGTPTFAPDNNTMFFGRGYKNRTKTGWSTMKRLGKDFEPFAIMRVTSSIDGTLAFDEVGEQGNGILRYSTLNNGQRSAPKPFPTQINTGIWNAHPFIAPDESYLIWDSQRNQTSANSDLFISFKQPDGTWGAAIKFADNINTPDSEFAAQVTPDGKYLFFNRTQQGNTDTFWIDAQVIESLRADQLTQLSTE